MGIKKGVSMKAINGNLDMSKRYKLCNVEYGELAEGSGENCENCGNLIANVAIVEREDQEKFRIGLDCMNIIIHLNPNEKQQAKNTIARERKFYKFLSTECKSIVRSDDNTGFGYKKIVTKWDVFYKYRFNFSKWESVIKSLNITIVYE